MSHFNELTGVANSFERGLFLSYLRKRLHTLALLGALCTMVAEAAPAQTKSALLVNANGSRSTATFLEYNSRHYIVFTYHAVHKAHAIKLGITNPANLDLGKVAERLHVFEHNDLAIAPCTQKGTQSIALLGRSPIQLTEPKAAFAPGSVQVVGNPTGLSLDRINHHAWAFASDVTKASKVHGLSEAPGKTDVMRLTSIKIVAGFSGGPVLRIAGAEARLVGILQGGLPNTFTSWAIPSASLRACLDTLQPEHKNTEGGGQSHAIPTKQIEQADWPQPQFPENIYSSNSYCECISFHPVRFGQERYALALRPCVEQEIVVALRVSLPGIRSLTLKVQPAAWYEMVTPPTEIIRLSPNRNLVTFRWTVRVSEGAEPIRFQCELLTNGPNHKLSFALPANRRRLTRQEAWQSFSRACDSSFQASRFRESLPRLAQLNAPLSDWVASKLQLNRISLAGSQWHGVLLTDTTARDTNFNKSNLRKVEFNACDLRDSDFRDLADTSSVSFVSCDLRNADLPKPSLISSLKKSMIYVNDAHRYLGKDWQSLAHLHELRIMTPATMPTDGISARRILQHMKAKGIDAALLMAPNNRYSVDVPIDDFEAAAQIINDKTVLARKPSLLNHQTTEKWTKTDSKGRPYKQYFDFRGPDRHKKKGVTIWRRQQLHGYTDKTARIYKVTYECLEGPGGFTYAPAKHRPNGEYGASYRLPSNTTFEWGRSFTSGSTRIRHTAHFEVLRIVCKPNCTGWHGTSGPR